jgi:hypothetical protein
MDRQADKTAVVMDLLSFLHLHLDKIKLLPPRPPLPLQLCPLLVKECVVSVFWV